MGISPTPSPEAQAPINHVGRMFGALFSPQTTFEEIAHRPSWIAPIILLTILSLSVSVLLGQKVNWEQVVAKSIEQSPQAQQLSPEQREQRIAIGAKFARVAVYVFGTLGSSIFTVIVAAIFLGAFNLLAGAGVRFGMAMAISSHALMPTAISSVLAIVVLMLKSADTIDPNHLLATNLGALFSSDSPKWLEKLAASVDLFWIWILMLLAMGFTAANPRKVSMGKALGIVFGLYIAFRLVVVGWAAAFS